MTTREERSTNGRKMRAMLFGSAADAPDEHAAEILPGVAELAEEAVYGAIWSRPGLGVPDRLVCTLAALAATERLPQIRRYVGAALDNGLTARAIVEVLLQSGLYAGFPATENAGAVAAEVFIQRGVEVQPGKDPDGSVQDLRDRGHGMLQRLHGDRGLQGYAAPDNPVTGALYPLAIEYGYGVLWHRPGLDVRQRALCAVAAFTALRLLDQVKKFGESALNAGLSAGEITEAVMQTAPYSGFPPALNALSALSAVLQSGDSSAADGGR